MERKIYYHDTDAIGIMYYGAYLKLLEEGRTEVLESKGISVQNLHKQQKCFVIKELNIDYKNPGFFGDIVVCESTIDKTTPARIFFSQKVTNKKTKKVLIEAKVVLVILNQQLKPIPISENFSKVLI